MGYGTDGLTFNILRGANKARLPEFKNSKGGAAHSKEDGSDWSPAQWLQATVGELGEWAQVRLDYEAGRISFDEYARKSAKELADVVTYLDILARRSLDKLVPYATGLDDQPEAQGYPFEDSASQVLMKLIAVVGDYANTRKKLERGDYTLGEYHAQVCVLPLMWQMKELERVSVQPELDETTLKHPGDVVHEPHATGVNLGQATMDKFNEVSARVGSRVFMDAADWHYRMAPPAAERRK